MLSILNRTKKDLIFLFILGTIFAYAYHFVAKVNLTYSLLIYLPLYIVYSLLYSLTKTSILKSINLVPAIIFFIWAITFPFLNGLSYERLMPFAGVMSDFYFGIFIFALLVIIQKLCINQKVGGYTNRLKPFILTLFDFSTLIIPITCWLYLLKYKVPMDVHGTFAIYQTNFSEAREYLQGTLSNDLPMVLLGFTIFIISFYLVYRLNKKAISLETPILSRKIKLISILAIICLGTGIFFTKTGIMYFMKQFHQDSSILANYKATHQELYNNITVDKASSSIEKTPGTIIVVIGESATRDRMKVYNKNVIYDNTPWLSKELNNKDFYIFNHGYSAIPSTVGVLQLALTKANIYNNAKSVDAPNILDIANKLGYHTVLASNQIPTGAGDSVIVQTMNNAKEVKYVEQDYSSGIHTYDESVMDLLKQIKPGNNFIIIHLMGSHFYYDKRFPPAFNKFPQEQHGIYANTLLYTDYVLQQIYDYSKEHLNLQAMVYFSDHGEDMKLTHNIATFKYNMTRIPFFIYLSPAYQKAYPETAQILANRKNAYFTNDLIYDLVVGLLHANGNAYTPEDDFSNKAYKYNEHNLLTNKGQHYLIEDPYYNTNNVPID